MQAQPLLTYEMVQKIGQANTTRPAIFKRRQRRPSSFFVPCAGIFATRSRCAMSKSYSPSAVCKRITRPSGVGFNVTVPNWNSDCAVISSQPTSPGGLTRRIFECTAVGVISTAQLIPPVTRSTSCRIRRAHRFASTKSAERRSASPVGLGSRINAFRSALSRCEGRRRRAIYAVKRMEVDASRQSRPIQRPPRVQHEGSTPTLSQFALTATAELCGEMGFLAG